MKRVFLIVLDSFGIGNAPDAREFGDEGTNTAKAVSASTYFQSNTLNSLGFGNIDGVNCVPTKVQPKAAVARMQESSRGKDTTIGHWEITGIVSKKALPTYPNGFPTELLQSISKEIGYEFICNKPYSGTQVIQDYGDEHIQAKKLIVYTSADSVFQIAAHEEIVPLDELYEICRKVRKMLIGDHGVGRVIARPFVGTSGHYTRTANRRDFSIEPPKDTLLDALNRNGKDVIAVGKINDIFAGRGITKAILTHGNAEGMNVTNELVNEDFNGLCFVNLVDFDMLYGHRRDVDGYAKAIAEFDAWLQGFLPKLQADDCLLLTADHGCDPSFTQTTDHTRECTPMLLLGANIKPINLGTRKTFADIGATVAELLDTDYPSDGTSFAKEILK